MAFTNDEIRVLRALKAVDVGETDVALDAFDDPGALDPEEVAQRIGVELGKPNGCSTVSLQRMPSLSSK